MAHKQARIVPISRMEKVPMTPAQKLARMTPTMWDMLRSVECYGGGYIRSPDARELARLGFIEMIFPGANGWHSARLTQAGVEALERSRKRRGQ
jgi:hypothetical protein